MKTKPVIFKWLKKTVILAFIVLFAIPALIQAQSLTGVQPNSGFQGQTLELMISGQNTNFTQATYVSVNIQQGTSTMIFPNSVTIVNNQLLKAVFNFNYSHNTGLYDLEVFSPPGYPMLLEDAFNLQPGPNPPAITGINPATAQRGQTLDITISGQYTHFQASSTTVWFNQGSATIYPNNNQVLSNTEIKSNFTFQYYHPVGYYDVNTYNETDGHLTLINGFFLTTGPTPNITNLQPSQGMAGTFIEFHITGQNTHFQDATEVVAFIQNNYDVVFFNLDIVSNTFMTASLILPYALGNYPSSNYDLYVFTNLDGPLFLISAFSALQNPVQPFITHIQPDSAFLGNTVLIEAFTENAFFTWSTSLNISLQRLGSPYPTIYPDYLIVESDNKITTQFTIPSFAAYAGLWDFVINDYYISGELELEGAFSVLDTITGININPTKSSFRVFPNPANNHVNIRTSDYCDECVVGIFNLAGQQMEMKKIKFEPGIPVRFDIDKYPEGIFMIKIITQNEIIVEKIIKN